MAKIREGGFLISKIKQVSERIFDKKLRNYGIHDLNTAQGRIIFSLWQQDNMSITELTKHTALGKTTLTSMLGRLEQNGYIVSSTDKKDKRKTIITLSQKSKLLEKYYTAVSNEMTALFYEGFSDNQIDELEDSLTHILSNLVKYEEENK